MTSFDDIPKPDWIPEAIRSTAKPLVDGTAKKAEDWEVVRRLLTDERMRLVWKELTQHARDPKTYKSTDKFLYAREQNLKVTMLNSQGKEHKYQQGLRESIVAFFVRAIRNAIEPIPTITRKDVMAKRAELLALHVDLVHLSERLRTWSNEPQILGRFVWWANKNHVGFDLPGLAATLDKASEFFRDQGQKFKPQGPRQVVSRRTKDEHTRAYVLNMAKTCRELFNSPLYSVIATTASVALKKDVTHAFVKRAIQRNR
jgi:hypothetical protein